MGTKVFGVGGSGGVVVHRCTIFYTYCTTYDKHWLLGIWMPIVDLGIITPAMHNRMTKVQRD